MPSYLLNLCFFFPVHITSTLIFKQNFSALLLKSCLYHTWSIASSFCGLKFIYIEAAMHLNPDGSFSLLLNITFSDGLDMIPFTIHWLQLCWVDCNIIVGSYRFYTALKTFDTFVYSCEEW